MNADSRNASSLCPCELQVQPALDFLLASGLGDPDADVRELMVTAGALIDCLPGILNGASTRACLAKHRFTAYTAVLIGGGGASSHCHGCRHSGFLGCAGVALVDAHGPQHSAPMLAVFDRYLDGSVAAGTDEDTYDRVREGVVVLLGTLARHLPPSDPKVGTAPTLLLSDIPAPPQGHAAVGCRQPAAHLPAPVGIAIALERAACTQGASLRLLLRTPLTGADGCGDAAGGADDSQRGGAARSFGLPAASHGWTRGRHRVCRVPGPAAAGHAVIGPLRRQVRLSTA